MSKRVLAFMAHPDDVEFKCAGTLARLHREAGCHISIATSTGGDAGSTTHRIEEILRIRHQEALAAAKLLNADYYCAGCKDVLITYDEPTLRRFVEIVRKARPDIVFTHPPVDYMVDHEMTSKLVRTAAFIASGPNFLTYDPNPAEVIARTPFLYYADPLEEKDIYGQPVAPSWVVDISGVQQIKEQMLACHASQRDWLRAHHGIDEYIESMRRASAARGRLIGQPAGEGFRQHLGHGYPQENVLSALLTCVHACDERGKS